MAAKSEVLASFGLTVAQYTAMLALYYVPGQSSAQLARASAVTAQTMGGVLGKLEGKGLIGRAPSRVHRKVLVTTLTPAGEALLLRADAAARGVEEGLGSAFSASERELFRGFLRRAAGVLRGEGPAARG